jgi:tetratricopeptide (TPR) repeat protein
MEEGLQWLQRAIERAPERTLGHGRALRRVGDLFGRLGRPGLAAPALWEAHAIAAETGDMRGLCIAERDLAWTEHARGRADAAINLARTALGRAHGLGDERLVTMAESDLATFLVSADEALDEAQDLLAASLAYYRRIGDETNVATVLNNLAGVAIARGDAGEARRYPQESLETARRVEAVYQTSYAAGSLGFLSLREGDKATALQRYREALDVALEFGAAGGILSGIEGIALSASSVDPHRAARLLGAVQAIRAEHELRLDPIEEATFERLIEAIRCDLGEDVFDEEASSGAASFSIEYAATLALDLSSRIAT